MNKVSSLKRIKSANSKWGQQEKENFFRRNKKMVLEIRKHIMAENCILLGDYVKYSIYSKVKTSYNIT